jgi:hypothetical protein
MRGLTSTILLVVVLAGLGAYIYFVDSERPPGGVEERQKVFTIEADKIAEIRVTSDSETTLLRKLDGSWKMVEPVQADADQTEVSNLTSNLATLEVNRFIDENAGDLTKYGLAQPRMTVAFKGSDGAAGEVHLGDKTATQGDMYAVKAGERRVFLVSAFQESTFAKKPFDLRDKRILSFERDKVDTIEIAHGGQTTQLSRSGSEWTMKQPVQARADYGVIEGLLTRLSSTNMTKIVEGTPAGAAEVHGFDKPQATATLGSGSARSVLVVGKEAEGGVYARDQARNLIFVVDKTIAEDLTRAADEYRDKDLFEFRSYNAARLRFSRGSDNYEFQKVKGTGENAAEKWQRVNAGGAATDVDAAAMDDLLSKVAALRAESFVATAPAASVDQPVLTVAASYEENKFERVRFGKSGTDVLAAREGEPGAARIDASNYDSVIKALDAVLSPAKPTT